MLKLFENTAGGLLHELFYLLNKLVEENECILYRGFAQLVKWLCKLSNPCDKL